MFVSRVNRSPRFVRNCMKSWLAQDSSDWRVNFLYGSSFGSLYVSRKLPTYPSPKPTLTLTSHLGQNVGLEEGKVGSFREIHIKYIKCACSLILCPSHVKYHVGIWPNLIAYSGGENRQPEISLCLHASLILIALKNIC